MANDTRPTQVPVASDEVTRAIKAGWSSLADGAAAVTWYRYRARVGGRRDYRTVDLRAGKRRVEVSISPTGRQVRVFVDGQEVEA